jgi:hypothetical protein
VCCVWPRTQGWAQSWNEQFTGAVFTNSCRWSPLKLGGLLVTAVLRLEPDVSWQSFLMGAATLWLTWRIPGLIARVVLALGVDGAFTLVMGSRSTHRLLAKSPVSPPCSLLTGVRVMQAPTNSAGDRTSGLRDYFTRRISSSGVSPIALAICLSAT